MRCPTATVVLPFIANIITLFHNTNEIMIFVNKYPTRNFSMYFSSADWQYLVNVF